MVGAAAGEPGPRLAEEPVGVRAARTQVGDPLDQQGDTRALAVGAGSLAPLEDDARLHRRVAELVAGETGDTVSRSLDDRVATAMRTVAEVCSAGPLVPAEPGRDVELITWWERHVERRSGGGPG